MVDGRKQTHHSNGLRIATRCETIEDFIEKFHRFCEDGAVFVPHGNRQVGTETAFAFDLVTGQPALCGLGTVLDHFKTIENRFGRPGIVIGIQRLTSDSQTILERMLVARAIAAAATAADGNPAAPKKRAQTILITPSKPQPTVPDLGRLTPIPVRTARAVTSAIEILDSVALKAATVPGPSPRAGTAQLPRVTLPTRIPSIASPPQKLADASSALPPSELVHTMAQASGSMSPLHDESEGVAAQIHATAKSDPATPIDAGTKAAAESVGAVVESPTVDARDRLEMHVGGLDARDEASAISDSSTSQVAPLPPPPLPPSASSMSASAASARAASPSLSASSMSPAAAMSLAASLSMTPSRRPAFLRSRRLVFGAAGVTCLAAASLLLVLWTRHDDAPAARPGPPPTEPLAALTPPDATPALAPDAQVAIATAPTPPPTLVKKPVTKHPVIKRKSVAKKTAVTKKPAVATKKPAIAPKKKSFVAPKKKPKGACASLSCL